MKIGFVVNDVATEQAVYTTTRLAMTATNAGHEAWVMGMGDFGYEPDGTLTAWARGGADKKYRSAEVFLGDVQAPERAKRIALNEFDVVMLRADPAGEEASWANNALVAFGQLMAKSGVLVVNDPSSLANALSKAYFQHFPEVVRPRTLISRDKDRIEAFVEELGGKAVLKPLQGSGGSGVFLIDGKGPGNLSQIVEAINRDGYVVAQEYLPAAKDGDVRMFVMNGEPLQIDGTYAAFRRRPAEKDVRSNISAGGSIEKASVTDEMLRLVEAVRPKLVADGMFLVGLDIVGDKLMEVNVFSPGGLGSAEQLYGADFTTIVIADLERKVAMRRHYGNQISNTALATL